MKEYKDGLIQELCELEWEMFDKVNAKGTRAACQEDPKIFKQMRCCQFMSWNMPLLESYRRDVLRAKDAGRNLVMEKYAFMMESSCPREFGDIKDFLPLLNPDDLKLVEYIVTAQLHWKEEVDKRFPHFRAGGRPLRSSADSLWGTSFETYLRGELKTFSTETLGYYASYIQDCLATKRNLAHEVAEHIAHSYGYTSLHDADEHCRR